MKKTFSIGFVALTTLAATVLACGDDDLPEGEPPVVDPAPTPDAGPQPETDATAPPPDAATDAGDAGAFLPLTPSVTRVLPNTINPYGLLFGADGLLYASGATLEGGERRLAVWRFQADGALDPSFGTNGVVTTDLDGDESSFDLVEVSPGSFVVQAVAAGKVWLVKLAKDAAGRYAFGAPVMVPFAWADGDFSGWPAAEDPAYNSWGIGLDTSTPGTPKIVVFAAGAPPKAAAPADQRTDNDRWIARVLADTLAPDPAFNGGKAFSTDIDGAGLPDNARRGLVLEDGSIVSSGYTNFGGALGNHVALVRLTAAGEPDPAFGFGTTTPIPGQTKFNPFREVGGFSEAYAVVPSRPGRYVTTGYGVSNFDEPSVSVDLVSFALTADGLDTTYGRLGAFAWQSEGDKSRGLGAAPFSDRGRDLVALPDGRLVHVGVYDDHASVFVTDDDGTPDPSSGIGGLITYAYPRAFFKVAVSPDGKRVAATAQSTTNVAAEPPASLLVTLDVGN